MCSSLLSLAYNINISLDYLNAGRIIKAAGVKTYVIVHSILPIPAGIVFIVKASVLICLFYKLQGILFRNAVGIDDVFNCCFFITVNKQSDNILTFLQNIISASADNDSRLFFSKLFYNLCLKIKKVAVRCEFLA